MDSKLTRWCDGFLEAGWLFALIVTPLFFNIHSERVFEPDKLTLLRSLALLMAIVWLVKFVDQRGWRERQRWALRGENSVWRMPLAIPVLVIVVIYIISTLFSVAPRTSLWGSYQRLQGTYTTFSYIVVFAVIVSTMRTRAQIQRLVTTVIVTSIPIALYGMLQKFELDPLPWGGNTSKRIAGHMGNAIFIAAYLIMVVPLTATRIIDSFRNILTDEDLSYADVIRSSIYILTLALQLMAIYWSQSRGPLLGIGVGMFAFVLILLVSLRNVARAEGGRTSAEFLWPTIFVILSFGALFVISALSDSLSGRNAFFAFGGIIGVLFLAVFILAAARIGWRWLWLAWIAMVTVVGAVLLMYNIAQEFPDQAENNPLFSPFTATFDKWADVPTINRLGQMLDQETGSSQVRLLIWEGAIDLVTPHEPLAFPTGEEDGLNFIRPIIGYGPEAMYVAYNRFYPPELATVESRNASPDRSHNETFDALVITGAAGFVAWQVLYIAVFYYGFRQLGVVQGKRDRNIFVGMWIAGAIVTSFVLVAYNGIELLGVSIPFGSILGVVAYLIYYALFGRNTTTDNDNIYNLDTLLMTSLITALIAFYVEIHFGIAIAATRVHSFAFMGLIVILGYVLPRQIEAEPNQSRGRRSARTASDSWWGVVLAAMFIMTVLLGTLGFDFINFSPRPGEMEGFRSVEDLPSAAQMLHRAYFENPRQNFTASPYLFGVVVLSWLLGTLLFVSEMIKSGTLRPSFGGKRRKGNALLPPLSLGGLALVGLLGFVLNYFNDSADNVLRVGGMFALVWGLMAGGSAIAYQLYRENPLARASAGAVTATGTLFAIPLLMSGAWPWLVLIGFGSAVTLYLVWEDSWNSFLTPFITIGLGSIAIGGFYMFIHAGQLRRSLIQPPGVSGLERTITEATRVGGFLTTYYIYVIVLLFIAGSVLVWNRVSAEKQAGSTPAFATLAILLVIGIVGVNLTNLNVIQADMTYKRGRPYDQQGGRLTNQLAQERIEPEQLEQAAQAAQSSWQSAVAIYEEAISMVPSEDFYYLWLGRAYLEQTRVDQARQSELLDTAEARLTDAQRINPLNTDHTANLARLNSRWAGIAGNPETRQEKIERAKAHYNDALALSPQNSVIRNEYARLQLDLDKDCDSALATLDQSVTIDPYFDQTYLLYADTLIRCAQAEDGGSPNLDMYAQAMDVLTSGFENIPEALVDDAQMGLAQAQLQIAQQYLLAGEVGLARESAETARTNAPQALIAQIDDFLSQIDGE